MAALVQPNALEAMWTTLIGANPVKVALLDSSYVYDAAHDFYSDLTGVLGTPEALTGNAYTGGIFTAANPLVSGVNSPNIVTQAWFYIDTGVAATSRLLVYTDKRADGSAISYPGDGADITLTLPGGEVGRI